MEKAIRRRVARNTARQARNKSADAHHQLRRKEKRMPGKKEKRPELPIIGHYLGQQEGKKGENLLRKLRASQISQQHNLLLLITAACEKEGGKLEKEMDLMGKEMRALIGLHFFAYWRKDNSASPMFTNFYERAPFGVSCLKNRAIDDAFSVKGEEPPSR